MVFRRAISADTGAIMNIMEDARRFMAQNGVVQWVNGYPSRKIVAGDIEAGDCYVMEDGGGVCACATVLADGEPSYARIYDGAWLTGKNERYLTMHRVAVAERVRGTGVAPAMVDEVKARARREGYASIRIDTHRDNLAMQRMLAKTGFEYCGVILLANDGSERIAFEWPAG